MRVKTEAKRQEILQVAGEVFEAHGFAAASMSQIAARVGGSKGTLYSYFTSKEDLFITVMLELARTHKRHLETFTRHPDDIYQTLLNFACAYLAFVTTPWFTDMYRTVIGFNNPDARRDFFEKGPKKGLQVVQALLQQAIETGQLSGTDTACMALQFKALLGAEVMQPLLFNGMASPDAATLQAMAERACHGFIRMHAPPARSAESGYDSI